MRLVGFAVRVIDWADADQLAELVVIAQVARRRRSWGPGNWSSGELSFGIISTKIICLGKGRRSVVRWSCRRVLGLLGIGIFVDLELATTSGPPLGTDLGTRTHTDERGSLKLCVL